MLEHHLLARAERRDDAVAEGAELWVEDARLSNHHNAQIETPCVGIQHRNERRASAPEPLF